MAGTDDGWGMDDYDPDDDWYDDDRDEPDEPDWGYEEWRASYEDHCMEAHGGRDCDCRPPLRERLGGMLTRIRQRLRRPRSYTDEPPF